ncbi:hypothetical protein BOTBODRAFT_392782 [Botryobasidium botryosum FD-172 SS1]|uniref:Uncharacterized protein n=1 Tax=Botryobasidium botryosum (strain FD-172 SS1) TaxID=930990 RepID=A0A067N856_BOTB1|nr:hypothetical protein BOTBODRAFT_392782 [Botryobasidium botryosum FD-172 SS1]
MSDLSSKCVDVELGGEAPAFPRLMETQIAGDNVLALGACQRDEHGLRRARSHTALPTTRHIPPEVLCEIFMFYGQFHDYRASKLNQLCLVDRTWHSVAMATPRLWCRIRIGADSPESDYTVDLADDEERSRNERRIEGLIRYTSRSGIAPLDVSIYHVGWEQGYPDILMALRPSMKRWRGLHVVNEDKEGPYKTLSFCVDALPSLERLSLCNYSEDAVVSAPDPLHSVPASSLKELTMEGVRSVPCTLFTSFAPDRSPPLPWLQGLTSLTLKHVEYDFDPFYSGNICIALHEARSLESLTLDMQPLFWPDDSELVHIEMPALRYLCIRVGYARECLRCFTAPALEFLWFGDFFDDIEYLDRCAHALTEFIDRSAPPLRELYISDDGLDTDLLCESVLSTLHELEALTLIGAVIPEDGMRLLWAPMDSSGAWACPRLRSFSATNASAAYFLRLLEARNPPLDSPVKFNINMPARVTHVGCMLDAQDMEAIAEVLGSYPTRVDLDLVNVELPDASTWL